MEKVKSLRDIIKKSHVFLDLKGISKDEIISEMLINAENGGLRVNITNIIQGINKKEEIITSGLGYGVAFPHVATKEVSEISLVFGISKNGVDYKSIDDKPVHFFCMILSPEESKNEYVAYLSLFSKTLRMSMYPVVLSESKTEEEFKEKMINILESM